MIIIVTFEYNQNFIKTYVFFSFLSYTKFPVYLFQPFNIDYN